MSTVVSQGVPSLSPERQEELVSLVNALRESLTSESVQSLVRLGTQLGELADVATRPGMASLVEELSETGPALERLLGLLRELEANGGMRRLEELLTLVKAMADALTSESVTGLLSRLLPWLELLDRLGDSALVRKLPAFLDALDQWVAEPPSPQERGGLLRLVRAAREPEIQDVLTAGLHLARRMAPVLRAG
ncbi:MAG: hypothetical protein QJR14_02875 [Bacillota bacterium]|nr:hypothetical protein [Bacillota bacterium]